MKYAYALIIVLGLYACKVNYSFTGTSTGDAKTLSIETFRSTAPLLPPEYTQTFTEDLKELFLRQTNLDLVVSNGDLQITGIIKSYSSRPSATTGSEQTSQNRLTTSVQIKYVNMLDPTQNYNKSFSRFEDYSSDNNLSDVQDELFQSITQQLAQDIIQASIGTW